MKPSSSPRALECEVGDVLIGDSDLALVLETRGVRPIRWVWLRSDHVVSNETYDLVSLTYGRAWIRRDGSVDLCVTRSRESCTSMALEWWHAQFERLT